MRERGRSNNLLEKTRPRFDWAFTCENIHCWFTQTYYCDRQWKYISSHTVDKQKLFFGSWGGGENVPRIQCNYFRAQKGLEWPNKANKCRTIQNLASEFCPVFRKILKLAFWKQADLLYNVQQEVHHSGIWFLTNDASAENTFALFDTIITRTFVAAIRWQ